MQKVLHRAFLQVREQNMAKAIKYDRSAEDSGNIVSLEHVNVQNSLLKMRSENIDIWSPC